MAFWVLLLRVHNRPDLIQTLVSLSGLRRDAIGIDSWIKSTGFVVSAFWTFRLDYVYYKVLCHLVKTTNSTLISRFLDITRMYDTEVEFILTTQQKHEMVWSCGLSPRSKQLKDHKDYGFNIYGGIITRVYHMWYNRDFNKFPSNSILTTPYNNWDTKFRHTVLVIADSQCKQLQTVYNGKVISVGGAKYHTLADAITKYRIRVTDYKFIIIVCGVNMCKKHDRGYWYRSWTSLIKSLRAVMNNNRHNIIMNLPIWTKRAPFVTEHAKFMLNMIQDISNVTTFDWSDCNKNPFVTKTGRILPEMFNKDLFHVNHMGFRQLWRAWCEQHNALASVSYKLSAEWYTQT